MPARVLVLLGALSVVLHAQAPPPSSFDVASIKQNLSGDGQRGLGFQAGGRFGARNMTIRGVIAAAYGEPQPIPLFRVVGGPGWIDSDRYDIEAVAPAEIAATMPGGWNAPGQAMLRALLASRFKLSARQQMRDLPAYALRLVREDRALGPQLRIATVDCVMPTPGIPLPQGQIACGGFGFAAPNRVSSRALTMDELARYIMLNAVDRPVVNETGLAGRFSMDLEFTRDATADGTSIFTAVREQLGLKLDPTTVPMNVVVIDAIERPTPD